MFPQRVILENLKGKVFLLDHGFMCNSNQDSLVKSELVGEMRNDYVTTSLL